MQLSSVVSSPKMLLWLCISTLRCIFTTILSKFSYWTAAETCKEISAGSLAAGKLEESKAHNTTTPTSVNYHFTRKCNYKCGFCFHTAKTSFVLPLEEAKKGLKLLKQSGIFTPKTLNAQ